TSIDTPFPYTTLFRSLKVSRADTTRNINLFPLLRQPVENNVRPICVGNSRQPEETIPVLDHDLALFVKCIEVRSFGEAFKILHDQNALAIWSTRADRRPSGLRDGAWKRACIRSQR